MNRILFHIVFFSLFFFSWSNKIHAQKDLSKIDSLTRLINLAADDSNKVNLYFELARCYDYKREKENFDHNLTALDLAKKINYVNGVKKLYLQIVTLLFYRGAYDPAIAYYHDYEKYLSEHGLKEDLLRSYNMYGNLLSKQKKFKEAQRYYHLTRAYHVANSNFKELANVINNISISHLESGNYDSALVYANVALEMYKRTNGVSAMANANLGIAEILLKQKDYEGSEKRAKESFDIYNGINEYHGMCNCLFVLGEIYIETKAYDKAMEATKGSLKLAQQQLILVIERDCYFNMAKINNELGRYKEAYQDQRSYTILNDSIVQRNVEGKMMEMEVKYDISNKENELKAKDLELSAKSKQRNYLLAIIAGVLVLFIISFRAYDQKKKSNKVISEQKKLVEEREKEIIDSIRYAKRIQGALLAGDQLLTNNLKEHFVLYKPKDIVSGDFYWAHKIEDKFLLCTADCTGHGVPGAFMSLLNISFLNEITTEKKIVHPDEILNSVRQSIILTLNSEGNEESQDGMDCTLCCFDLKNKKLEYAAANNSFYIIRDGKLMINTADKMPVGKSPNDSTPFTKQRVDLQIGDLIYTFTDGYADQFGGPKGKKFKYKALEELLLANHHLPMFEQRKLLSQTMETWQGSLEQVDDILIIGIKV